jgi:transposase
MFVRKKSNKSGKISIQIIDKSKGKYQLVKTIGCSSDTNQIELLVIEAERWIRKKQGLIEFDFSNKNQLINDFLDGIESLGNVGIELLLGKIFNQIGFDKIDDNMFRLLVLSRLSHPSSKLKTTDYLFKYHNLSIDVQVIYRYLDKLYKSQKEKVQQISYNHTLTILENTIQVVFYDVTTMYFEVESEDELRKTGFSKDGKHQNPQIVLGLLVSKNGYPLAYEIFEGNKYEGHTMLPVIKGFKEKYKIENFIVVADAGLLSNDNITELEKGGYEYILGARLKNESDEIKKTVLELKLKNGESVLIKHNKRQYNIVVSYSENRAKKDAYNRNRGIEKLQKQITSGKLGKKNINNRGYNKFLVMEGEIEIKIDQEKILSDKKWDGLKGYISNSKLNKDEIIENYKHLWQIEKAFRISKSDLKVRPIYHRVQRRIEAHICITFCAYKVYKELERLLKDKKSDLSPEKAIDIAKSIMSIKVRIPDTRQIIEKVLFLKDEQRNLAQLFEF